MEISYNEYLVLDYIKDKGDFEEYNIKIENLDQRNISSAISYLKSKGLINLKEYTRKTYYITSEAENYINGYFPEEKLYNLLKINKKLRINEAKEELKEEFGIALANLSKYGIKPNNGYLDYSETNIEEAINRERNALNSIKTFQGIDNTILEKLKKRGLVREKKNIIRVISINEAGVNSLKSFKNNNYAEALTSEMISSGEWKNKKFRPYDLNMRVEEINGAGLHPLTYLIEKIRNIFLNMGFTEMHGHFIEYTAWNMDMLFIPQDHPARDLQDTFYITSEKEMDFENPEILNLVKKIHERGYKDYSGWNYRWSLNEGKKLIMRTHTTVNTIRYLYNHREAPQYMFSIEKVFRHESVDWKHLSELYQIEGAVYSKNANLSTLKWLMHEFYSRLGFKDIKLLPSYYPYTEPSMDVIVNINGKEVELGGSGIFRPEVTGPIGLKYPVFAFGLGLERLAMIYYGLDDIREIYNSDIDWLKNYKIKF